MHSALLPKAADYGQTAEPNTNFRAKNSMFCFQELLGTRKSSICKFKPEESHLTVIFIQVCWHEVSGRDFTLSCTPPTRPVYLHPGWNPLDPWTLTAPTAALHWTSDSKTELWEELTPRQMNWEVTSTHINSGGQLFHGVTTKLVIYHLGCVILSDLESFGSFGQVPSVSRRGQRV